MTKARRFFTDEFKQEAVALLESSGRPLEHIAKELDIQPSVLRTWRPPWPPAIRLRRLPA